MKKVFILVLIGCITCFFSCSEQKKDKGAPYDYLGKNATSVYKITNPNQLKTDIKANSLIEKTAQPILKFISTSEILSAWKSQSPFYFSASGDGEHPNIVFAKSKDTLEFSADSIPNALVEKITEKNYLINKILLNKDSLFTAIKDSVSIFSTNKATLLAILTQKEHALNKASKKLLELPQESDFVKIGETRLYPKNILEVNKMLTSQAIQVLPEGIHVSGIIKSKDSSLIDVFKGQTPQTSEITAILPNDFKRANGFTFSDSSLLIRKLKDQKQDSTLTTTHPILETLTEIAEVELKTGKCLVMTSIDAKQSFASIDIDIREKEQYRDITIYESNLYTAITPYFSPLLSKEKYSYLFILDRFIVNTTSIATAKETISAYLNKNVITTTPYFKLINAQMLTASSMYSLGQGIEVKKITNTVLNLEDPVKKYNEYPLAALQYSYDNNFAHLNFVAKEITKSQQITGTVSQKFSEIIDQPILGNPQFFTNHRTRGQDVVAQDVTNTLHLFSIQGKKLWSLQLDGPILGEINEIDILRNGKKQFAFATQKTFYVLDRNGKEVAPFSLKFKDDITQPLAVFDYDNNRKYRFLITQGNTLLMYDSKGKSVKGFTFKKTETSLVFPPKHIRISTKDFIVLAEENGKATFLSRTGKERITAKEKFKFGTTPIQKEGANFVVISANKKKHTINTAGVTTTHNLNISDSYYFKTLGNTKVTLDDNLLRINEILVELPFGMYTEPQLINHKSNTYIAVTDMQEHKVYVYDKNRKLLEGFPVYGTSKTTLAISSNKLVIVTKGSEKEIICYQVN